MYKRLQNVRPYFGTTTELEYREPKESVKIAPAPSFLKFPTFLI